MTQIASRGPKETIIFAQIDAVKSWGALGLGVIIVVITIVNHNHY